MISVANMKIVAEQDPKVPERSLPGSAGMRPSMCQLPRDERTANQGCER
jgi:hypothetical protein